MLHAGEVRDKIVIYALQEPLSLSLISYPVIKWLNYKISGERSTHHLGPCFLPVFSFELTSSKLVMKDAFNADLKVQLLFGSAHDILYKQLDFG